MSFKRSFRLGVIVFLFLSSEVSLRAAECKLDPTENHTWFESAGGIFSGTCISSTKCPDDRAKQLCDIARDNAKGGTKTFCNTRKPCTKPQNCEPSLANSGGPCTFTCSNDPPNGTFYCQADFHTDYDCFCQWDIPAASSTGKFWLIIAIGSATAVTLWTLARRKERQAAG